MSIVQDWRGRRIAHLGFVLVVGVDAASLISIEAFPLTSGSATVSCSNNRFNVDGAYDQHCAIQELVSLEGFCLRKEL